ncbi:PaaX family transcriptional regulator [Salinibacterium sp. SYSU T00001]|uniref:PaaX family transcriptional regulator n=1 Tax=Homoserinimonas sedimenticola TaxID=2986805 RepID=UPI002235F149|nr:PaaX family transcriptional regulator C-terminal domain-containing protein [Salinibacterium sedimenticola]MCW4384630.1 PaaX family transcriptional regulator [Salinibacterium sedimenticola]
MTTTIGGETSMDFLPPGPHLPRSTTGREPQYLLVTLLGDYWSGRREKIPSSALVDLLAEFGVTESSARQAMRRLTNRRMLEQAKSGRTTFYGIPEHMSESTVARRRRVLRFGLEFTDWDEHWTVVSFSIPEKDRDVRRLLRNGLRDLKFGLLNDAIWVSPHHRVEQATALLEELDVTDASVMRAQILERPGREQSFIDVFDLRELEREYRDFIARHEPMVEKVIAGRVAPSEALVLRTEVMSEWLQFRQVDPTLPSQLLPEDWPRRRAREVAYHIYDELGTTAEGRFRQIIGNVDRSLASLASHHTSRDA